MGHKLRDALQHFGHIRPEGCQRRCQSESCPCAPDEAKFDFHVDEKLPHKQSSYQNYPRVRVGWISASYRSEYNHGAFEALLLRGVLEQGKCIHRLSLQQWVSSSYLAHRHPLLNSFFNFRNEPLVAAYGIDASQVCSGHRPTTHFSHSFLCM